MPTTTPASRRLPILLAAAAAVTALLVASLWLLPVGGQAHPARAGLLGAVVLLAVAVAQVWRSSLREDRLRRSNDELRALASMAHKMAASRRPTELVGYLLDGVAQGFGSPRAAAVVCDDPKGAAEAFVLGEDGAPRRVASGPAAEAVSALDPLLMVSHGLDPTRDALLARALPDAAQVVVLPLVAHGRAYGSLAVEREGGRAAPLAEGSVDQLGQFALHAAMALRAASLQAEVERLAGTDALTGLANRRTFQDTLVRELALARRRGEPCGLIVLDVDHFKAVNYRHGHQVGDEVLHHVGEVLTVAARQSDLPARFGGEEFAVILPNCSPGRALRVAERLRAAVAADPGVVPVTLSAGVASFPADGQNEEALIAAADAALYQAKSAGRDCAVRFESRVRLADELAS